MKYYFSIQYKRLTRFFEELGVYPYLAFVLLSFLFIALSYLLYYKTTYASWLYLIVAFSFLIKLGERSMTRTIKIIYEESQYLRLRLVENGLVSLPFIIFLLYKSAFLFALALIFVTILLAFVSAHQPWHKVMPTPFKSWPFEAIVGFRSYWWLILLLYFLVLKAFQVDNYNLGLVTMGFLFMTVMSFFVKPEQKYFVWIFSDRTKQFLSRKIGNAILCAIILVSPVFISLGIMYPERLRVSVIVLLLGCLFVCAMVVAKYSAFPKEMSVPQAIIFALGCCFPPALLLIIPLMRKQAIRQLEPLLG